MFPSIEIGGRQSRLSSRVSDEPFKKFFFKIEV